MFFKSDFGNIVYDCYEAQNPNGIVIQIAHGMVEHRGRYVWLCNKLSNAGYKVYINDHRGHGDSIGGEIVFGEMGKDGFEMAVKDMLALNEIIKEENPNTKMILLGHSMGSLLSRRFLQLYEERLDALILSGTPSPNRFAGFGSKLSFFFDSISFNDFFQKIGRNLVNKFSLGSFNVHFRHLKPYSKSHWICSDYEVVKAYDADEKTQFVFSLNSFGNLLKGLKQVFSPYPNPIKNKNLPILFLSGKDDACGNFSKGVNDAYEHLCTQGYQNVSLKLYEDCRHEVFNEKQKEQYLQDMLEWLKKNNL